MDEKKYLKWYNKVGYGSGDLAGNMVYAFLSSFVMLYLTNTVGLNPGIVGTLIMVSKLFDGISKSYFSHTFRKRMGVSPVQYLNTQRIEKAKEFLLSNSMSISTIARLVGFDDPLYFSRVFKKHTGIAPQMFYQKVGNANTPEWFLQQPPKS